MVSVGILLIEAALDHADGLGSNVAYGSSPVSHWDFDQLEVVVTIGVTTHGLDTLRYVLSQVGETPIEAEGNALVV